MNRELLITFFEKQQELLGFLKAIFLNAQTLAIMKYLGLAMAFLVVFVLIKSVRDRMQPRGVPLTSRPGGKRIAKKEALRAEKRGDYQQAGELYRMIGHNDKAIEMYKQAKSHRDVAFLYEQDKQWGEAAQYYETSGNLEKAALMWQKQGEYIRAGELLARAWRLLSAAEMFERGESYGKAAELFKETGHHHRAAACYEKMNETLKAAEIYEQCFLQEKSRPRDPEHPADPADLEETNSYANQAGRLYLAGGQYQKAAAVLTSAGLDSEAADALLMAGEYKKAAEIYYEKKMYDKAAQAYEQEGDPQRSYEIQGEMHLESGDHLEAAQCFEKSGNQLQAGEIYGQLGNHKKAAEMYLQGGDCRRAAESFVASGEILLAAQALQQGRYHKEAAEIYVKYKEPEKAIEIYKEMGDYYAAAMVLNGMGRQDDSITLLQKVDSSSTDYHRTSLLLGKIFVEKGMLDAAKQRYEKIFSTEHPDLEALVYLYELSLAYEKIKEYEQALAIYEKILAEDYSFRDVKARADGLRRALGEVKKALAEAKSVSSSRSTTMGDSKGRYKILKKIGQGGMGVVYQAEDTVLHRIVAYKILPPAVREHPKILENFMHEARVAAGLTHTNIVTVYDTGKSDTDLYITMEYVDGVTLKELLSQQSPMPIPILARITKQVCLGLEYAHQRNVIHRDIKPANIMINKDQVVKIMDFGLAKIVKQSEAEKTTVKGTPMYMSPEQILGKGVDHQSDIYSLGCTLYRMATGRAPFTEGDLYYHHLHTLPTPPKTHNPQIPEAMNRLILKCIEKNKANRYQSISDVLKDLEDGLVTN